MAVTRTKTTAPPTNTPFTDNFLGRHSDPGRDVFTRRAEGRPGTDNVLGKLGATTGMGLQRFGADALPLGLSTLNQILFSQGKTDPRLMNRTLGGIARDTEAQQFAQAGSAAQRGLQNSGAFQAINAAIGQAGSDRQAGVLAQEAQAEEQRKRDDLGLLLSLIIGPGLQGANLDTQRGIANAGASAAEKGAIIGALADIGSSFIPTGGGGGNTGGGNG